jgi:hypothetical protein
LHVPAGFEGLSNDIKTVFQNELDRFRRQSSDAQVIIRGRFRELIDRPMLDGILSGLTVAAQSRDQEPALISEVRRQIVDTVIRGLIVLHSENPELALTCRFNSDDQSAQLRFTMEVDKDSRLQPVLDILSSRKLDSVSRIETSLDEVAVVGEVVIPAAVASPELVSMLMTISGGTETPALPPGSFWLGFMAEQGEPEVINVRVQVDRSPYSVAAKNGYLGQHFLRLNPDENDSRSRFELVQNHASGSGDSRTLLTDPQTARSEHESVVTTVPALLAGRWRLPVQTSATTEPGDHPPRNMFAAFSGGSELNRLWLDIDFPPQSDHFAFLLFDAVIRRLVHLGSAQPISPYEPGDVENKPGAQCP